MFWQRTDHTDIEKAAPVLPKEAAPASPIPVQRPPRSGPCIKISWHGPYSLDETSAEAFERGVYLVLNENPKRELIGRSAQSPFREAAKQAKEKGFENASVWIGEVQHADSGLMVQKRLLKRVSRALIFSSQPSENIASTNGLWVRNVWPENAKDPRQIIRDDIADREPEVIEVSAPHSKRWLIAAAIALLLAASATALLAFRPLDPLITGRLRASLEHAQKQLAQAQARVEEVTLQFNDASLKLSTALQKINFLESENAGLRARITASPSVTAAGGGIELQSCWKRADGKPSAVYRINIRDDAFDVEPAWSGAAAQWPGSFAATMKDFSGAPLVPTTPLSQDAFAAAMQPYYDFGTAPDRNCRFFVDVTDSTTTKEAWKTGLARVERYFYKRLVAPPVL